MVANNNLTTNKPTFWQKLRQKLLGAASALTDVGERRQAELLAGVALLMAISTIAGAVATYMADTTVLRSSTISLVITAVLSTLAYILGRTRHFIWGAIVLVFAFSASSFFAVLGGTDNPTVALYSFIVLALIIGSAMFSSRGLAIMLIANGVAIALLPLFTPSLNTREIISAGGIIGTFGILLIIVNNVRNSIERARLVELAQSNEALSLLRDSLESHVEERTHELVEAQARTQTLLAELDEASRVARLASYELEMPSQTLIFNDRFYELLGTSIRSVGTYRLPLSQAASQFVHPDDVPHLMRDIQLLGSEASSGESEYRMVHGDGRILTFSFHYVLETDAVSQFNHIKGAVQDITERKQAEEALRQTEDIYRRAIASADAVPYSRRYGDEVFTFMGEKIYQMTGYTVEEMTPAIFDSILEETLVHTTAMPHPEAVQQARTGEVSNWRADYRLRTQDGRTRWISDNSVELIGSDGQSTGSVGIMLDITERKEAEAALARQAAELEAVTELSTAVASISDPTIMLQTVVDLTQTNFDLYHAHIYLLNETGEKLELTAGSGATGRSMVSQKHAILFNREQSLVARAARTRQAVAVNDVTQDPAFLSNQQLPHTRAELAVPIIVGDDLLGVLDVQSTQIDYFTAEVTRIQTILAAQIGVALQNARAKRQSAQTLQELDAFTRRLTREGWQSYFGHHETRQLGFVLSDDELLQIGHDQGQEMAAADTVIKPITIRGERIGQVVAAQASMDNEEVDLILAAISQGLSAHLENLRLNEQTEQALAQTQLRTEELALINRIVGAVSATIDIQESLQIIIDETVKATSADQARVLLLNDDRTKLVVMAEHTITHSILGMALPVGADPLAAKVLDSRQTQVVEDPQHDPFLAPVHHIMQAQGIEQLIIIPLAVGNTALGTLALEVLNKEKRITPDELRLAETLVFQVATAVQNARLFEQVQARARQEQILREVSARVYAAPDVESVLRTAAQEINRILGVETAVYLDSVSSQPTNGKINSLPHNI